MKRFKNILFVSDNLEKGREAFNRATELAIHNQAKLTVAGSVKISTLDALIDHKTLSLGELQKRMVRERSAQLEEAISNLSHDRLEVISKVLLGGGFIEIIQEVLRHDHDLVIKAAESRAGTRTIWFGSDDLHLLRKCPCPVWLVKPTRRHRYQRILAAVDTDPVNAHSEQSQLNYMIMDLSVSIAEKENSELHVVHAWDLQGDDWMAVRASLSEHQINAIRQEVKERHKDAFNGLLASYEGLDISMRTHLIEGRAGTVIAEHAKRHDMGLVVMGTVARTGLPGFIIGNTAENVLNQVNCSVLTVKPQGFTTPVKLDK